MDPNLASMVLEDEEAIRTEERTQKTRNEIIEQRNNKKLQGKNQQHKISVKKSSLFLQ